MRFPRLLVLSLLPLVGLAQYQGATAPPADQKKGFDSITTSDAKRWLSYLAGPECLGRGSGQPGYQKAAEYMAARFKEFGLKPAGNNDSYFQYVPFIRNRYDPAQTSLTLAEGGFKAVPEKDFVIRPGRKDVEVTAPIVFVHAKGNPKGANLESAKDKIVVLWIEDGFMSKALFSDVSAQAAFVLVAVGKVGPQAWSGTPMSSQNFGGSSARNGYITVKAARALGDQLRIAKEFWEQPVASDTYVEAGSGREVKISAKAQSEQMGVPNVVGLLEGSDPALKEEMVAVGAHLDHMGSDGYTTWWGADDDASGSTALLATAKAFAKNRVKPKRSVLFIAFCGEELGLVGSEYFVGKPTVVLDKIQCFIQMDMVGRASFGHQMVGAVRGDDKLEDNRTTMRLVGSRKLSSEFDQIIRNANRYVGFKFNEAPNESFGGSDHVHFDKKGIPVALQFCGMTPDYHKPTDTMDKVDLVKVTNAARLSYLSLMQVGNMDRPLKRDKAN